MNIETAWVAPPSTSGGLDHLGAQAPCILIYGQLLPGITNVTDRARYYSFYPWLIWSLDHRFPKADEVAFVEWFRRADCLFTLIAEHHARSRSENSERHGAAMVGRQKLVAAVQRLMVGELLTLTDFTSADSSLCYFQNRLGGLSQYYAGTLVELGMLDGTKKPWYRYSSETGKPLASALEALVPADAFWKVVECGQVTADDLKSLHAFCPCHLHRSENEERVRLVDIFFDRNKLYEEDGTQRKRSLALIQRLINSMPPETEFSEFVFRGAVYGQSLPGGENWQLPADLEATRNNWAVYVRNDLMAVAMQAIFGLALRKLSPQTVSERQQFGTVETFARALSGSVEVERFIAAAGQRTFGDWLVMLQSGLSSPAEWLADDHELPLMKRILDQWETCDDSTMLQLTMRLLAILIIRDHDGSPYEGLAISPQVLDDYPINLVSFRNQAQLWRALPLEAVVENLVSWCMNTHLRIALRKLHRTGKATFRFRPTERGLQAAEEGIPAPSPTTPRFRQAYQILMDVGAVSCDDQGAAVLTAEGRKLMEAVHD
jgi:hypothetical protein